MCRVKYEIGVLEPVLQGKATRAMVPLRNPHAVSVEDGTYGGSG